MSITAGARQLSPLQQVAFVHEAVNRAVHRRMGARCGSDDGYWAAATETLARGMGDCVDIAVAKMEALRLLGVSAGDLYLTMGRGRSRTQLAALLVRVGDSIWLLDDRSDRILDASDAAVFKPIVTYGAATTWVHGLVKIIPSNTRLASRK